jgi:diguanylate cyclase
MSRVYVADVVADARNSQALNLQATGMDMALQTEGLRASLFDWHRQILMLLISEEPDRDRFPAIARTSFGLWVLHKGELMFPGAQEIKLLGAIVRTIDARFDQLFESRASAGSADYRQIIKDVDSEVTAATAILSAMTDRTMAMEGGRDSLTKLFNRRFLRTVMQKEIRLSQGSGDRFGLIMIDVDHFKIINDTYGHDTGDGVLKQIAEILVGSVRAGDFVFRYGGEEFLLLVGGMTLEILVMICEKIRLAVEQHDFRSGFGDRFTVTISLGAVLHDGHPDYQRMISTADAALFEAKRGGRNRYMVCELSRGGTFVAPRNGFPDRQGVSNQPVV